MTSDAGIPFDRVAEQYDATRGGDARGRFDAAALLPWIDLSRPVLEVGVGTGLVAAGIVAAGGRLVGVDLSLPMLRKAGARVPGRMVAGDARRLPIRSGSVGTAYFVHVLHLTTDVPAVLSDAARVCAAEGRVLAVCAAGRLPGSPVGAILEAARVAVQGPRRDDPERIVALAAATGGLSLEHRMPVVREQAYSPAEVARVLEQRVFSWTWDIPDTSWERDVVPAIAQIRALPDADRSQPMPDARTLLVFRRSR